MHQEAQRVERCLVGPVHVLDDEDGRVRGRGEFRPQRVVDPGAVAARREGPRQFRADAADEIPEGTERPARRQVVALPHQDARRGGQHARHDPHQARLADARLAVDEHHGTGSVGRLPGGRGQPVQLVLPFEDPPSTAPCWHMHAS